MRDAGRRAIADPRGYEARATLMWAGSVSHNDYTGCGRKRLFPVHKLEHELSAFRDEIAHGAGLSVLFPAWAEHEMPYDYPRFAQFANRVLGVEMDFEHPERTACEGIRTLRRFFEEIGMPTHLSQLGIKPENYEKLAANTVRTVNGPVKSYSAARRKGDHRNLPSRGVNGKERLPWTSSNSSTARSLMRGAGSARISAAAARFSARSHPMPRASR